jgi:DNA-binding Lrp family transcriptional regulator
MDPHIETELAVSLDAIDFSILHALQEDARHTTHEEISDRVDASPSTIRNRIQRLERAGVIDSYTIRVAYERAGFPLRLQFVCTADVEERERLAREVLAVCGVVDVREMLTSERNLVVEVVASSTANLAHITNELYQLDVEIHSSEIIANSYSRSFNYFDDHIHRDESENEGSHREHEEAEHVAEGGE